MDSGEGVLGSSMRSTRMLACLELPKSLPSKPGLDEMRRPGWPLWRPPSRVGRTG